jgi:glycosyltransferase involved in cell wall biosynthesis
MKLTVIILTFNEERHLARCIASVQAIASEIIVADCFLHRRHPGHRPRP